MPRTNDNVQGAEGGEEPDRVTPLNPDQLDLQFRTPEMETTSPSENTGTIDPALNAAINRLSTTYNPNGGSPRTASTGPGAIPKRGNQTNVSVNARNVPQPTSGSEFPTIDISSKEGKYSILDQIPRAPGYDRERGIGRYIPDSNEILFSKMKWSFNGEDPFEDFLIRLGGYARTLDVRDVCFKNTLFQAFRPPCSFVVSDMEPSMEPYRDMSRKSYAEALHERLEPASAAELIYTQYKERSQKPNEVFDLYLRDKYNLFVRSFPQGKTRIFKDFTEEAIRGLHNELLKIKIRDFISIQHLAGIRIETFDALRRIVQISVENIQSRAIAGELDTADIAGTDIRLMNYSYVNTSSSKDRKTRYEINVMDENEERDNINEFRNFQKFKKYNSKMQDNQFANTGRQPTEADVCYSCGNKGHFSRNCPRKNLPGQGIHKVDKAEPNDEKNSSDHSGSESDLEMNYVNYKRKDKTKLSSKKKDRNIHDVVDRHDDQIKMINSKLSEILSVLSPENPNDVNIITNEQGFPRDVNDISKDHDDDIFNFL